MKNDVQNDMGMPMPEGTIQPTVMANPTAQQMSQQPIETLPETPAMAPQFNTVTEQTVAPVNNGGNGLKAKMFSHGVAPFIAIGVVAVLIVAAVAYIMLTSSPTNVFKGAISNASKDAKKVLDTYDEYYKTFNFEEKAITIDFDASVDTNIKELTEVTDEFGFEIKDLKVGLSTGVDYKDEKVLVGGFVKGEKEKIDATMLIENGVFYIGTSLLEDVLKYEDETLDLDFSSLKDELESLEISFEAEDYKTIVNSVEKAINKSITSEMTEKEKDELEVAGKDLKLTKNSLVLDEKTLKEIIETVAEELMDDDDFLKALSNISGAKKGDIKEVLKDMKKSAKDLETDEEVKINIYTKGLFNKVVGFGVEYDGKDYVTYVENGDDFEFVYDDHMEDYGTKVVATVEDTKLTVKVNGEKIATGTVKELSEEKVDMTIKSAMEEFPMELTMYLDETKANVKANVEVDDVKYEVAMDVTGELKDSKYSGTYKIKFTVDGELSLEDLGTLELDKGYVSLSGSYGITASENLNGLKTKNAKDINEMTDADAEELLTSLQENLNKVMEKDDVFKTIYTLAEEVYKTTQDFSDDYYGDYDDDYYGDSLDMEEVWTVSEAEELLASKDLKILYVGSEEYNTGTPEHTMLESLKTIQDLYTIECRWFDYDYMYDDEIEEFVEIVSGISHTCSTGTCENYPALYIIKDGSVKNAYRGAVTVDELKSALSALGVN